MEISKDPKKTFFFFAFAVLAILSFFLIKENIYKKLNRLTEVDPDAVKINTQSNSDEVSEIKKDIDSTDVENIDKELINIEAELDTAI
ncbi:MAG TPA: hypothetical protein VI819_01165 [Patescibacteria group bacterium]|nr:hypothetical protein [Patescibacteria group bacterium]